MIDGFLRVRLTVCEVPGYFIEASLAVVWTSTDKEGDSQLYRCACRWSIHRGAEKPESAIQGFGKPADNRYEKDALQRKHCALERRLKNAPAARYVHS